MQVNSSLLAMSVSHTAADPVLVQEQIDVRPASSPPPSSNEASQDSVQVVDANLLIAQWLCRYFTGHDLPLLEVPRFQTSSARAVQAASTASTASVSYTRREVHRETGSSTFSAEGRVTLDSGKNVDFSLTLLMNRNQTEIRSVSFGAGAMNDPIAVNLDGLGVRLSGQKQSFDLNGDGMDETIATLASGSAWLAEDLNGNGKVDSGQELFGPASGNGFKELAMLDQDHNGWIDQGDAAYQRLGLSIDGKWTSLEDAGIGALSVASAATPFTLKGGSALLGQVRASGVYLRENGTPGALEQVDLTV